MVCYINGEEVYVSWQYTRYQEKKNKIGVVTTCLVKKRIGEKKWQLITDASTITKNENLFVKETGRKLSLARLLRDQFVTKEKRTEIWSVYFGRSVKAKSLQRIKEAIFKELDAKQNSNS